MLALLLTTPVLSACSSRAVAHDEPATVTFEPEAAAPQPGSDVSRDSYWSRGSDGLPLDAHGAEADLHGRLNVPPDRALLQMRAVVSDTDRPAVMTRVGAVSAQVADHIASEDDCSAEVVELTTATPAADDLWRAAAVVALDVDLRGLNDVAARHSRLEQCLTAVREAFAPLDGVEVRVGSALVTVDDPGAHRVELLERALAPMQDITDAAGALPAQFDPMGVRCRSTGQVTIASRSLGGVALEVAVTCEPAPASTAPVAMATAVR